MSSLTWRRLAGELIVKFTSFLFCLLSTRLSQEYLTGQVAEISTQLTSLQKSLKKAPDDLQKQVKTFLKEAEEEMKQLKANMKAVQDKTTEIANYFCEDTSKFKLEGLLMELNGFITELEQAKKVLNMKNAVVGSEFLSADGSLLLIHRLFVIANV